MKKRHSRQVFQTLHIYAGLLCAGFLIHFGVTGFLFHHHFKFTEPKKSPTVIWEAPFSQSVEDKDVLKEAIRDSLGLFGHLPWWLQHTDSLGTFHFTIMRPARRYDVTVLSDSQKVQVAETNTGIWVAMFGTHTSTAGGLETPIIKVWHVVSQVLAFLSFFVILSSVYIWRRKNKKAFNWMILSLSGFSTIALILYVWLVG